MAATLIRDAIGDLVEPPVQLVSSIVDIDSYASIPLARDPEKLLLVGDEKKPLARVRLSARGVIEVSSLPIGIFIVGFWCLSFSLHNEHPGVTWFIVAMLALIPITLAAKGYQITLHKQALQAKLDLALARRANGTPQEGDDELIEELTAELNRPNMFMFLGIATSFAWLAMVIIGAVNFNTNTSVYYNRLDLGGASNKIDPSRPGREYLDASFITFNEQTNVRQDLSLSFKNYDTYCVAPIGTSGPQIHYDFWAVGINCCDPFGGKFWCGNHVENKNAHSVSRVHDRAHEEFWRMAIQQAEANYRISTTHPLLFTWEQTPQETILTGVRTAGKVFWVGSLVFIILFVFFWVPFFVNVVRPQ